MARWPKRSVSERFHEAACPEPNSGCTLWLGAVDESTGYGMFALGTRRPTIRAHRLAWVLAYGSIPDGKFVLHKCDFKLCVNVRHLYLGTQSDNMRDVAIRERGRRSKLGLPFGVHKRGEKFRAKVYFKRKGYTLGTFDTADEASAVATAFKQKMLNAVE